MPAVVLRDLVVLSGPAVEPRLCSLLVVEDGVFTEVRLGEATRTPQGSGLVAVPGLHNAHTHLADGCAPDGATGLTLQQGFFRPDGFKYRMLAERSDEELLGALEDQLRFAASCGTVEHADFREQGEPGARLLRRASDNIGVRSLTLSQFDPNPFDEAVLDLNTAELPQDYVRILDALLETADGFSESTINDCTDPGWRHIREATEARGKLRAIHCLEDADYRATSLRRTGRGDLARALDVLRPHLVVHMTVADDAEIALLAASGVPAALNPRANATLGLPLPRVFALLEAGIDVRLGTDNAMLNPPNLLAEMDFTWRLARSQSGDPLQPDPARILRAATRPCDPRVPAVGIAEGARADVFLADFSQGALARTRHLVASIVGRLTPADVVATFAAGRQIHARHDAGRRGV